MMQMNAGILFFLLLVISESFILSEENVHGRHNRALLSRGGARYGYSDEEAIEFLEENDEEDEELPAPVPSTKATSSENVGVQFMITNKMRRVLEGPLGYLAYEVDEMDPQIASVVIDRALNRPSKGMPESWKRNRRSTDEYNTESLSIREDGDEDEDGESRQVLLPRSSMLSTVKRSFVQAKDSILGFGRAYIIPVLPAVFIGVCMYGVAVNSPQIVTILSGIVEKSHRESMRWIKSVRRASSSPSSQIKPIKIKICDPGDDNSNINSNVVVSRSSSKKVKVPESDSKSKKINTEKVVAPPRRILSPEAANMRMPKRTGVDLKALAAAQHLSIWEIGWLRMEMFKRSNF